MRSSFRAGVVTLAGGTLVALACFGVAPAADPGTGLQLDSIDLPPGFSIRLYARVPGARSLALGEQGTVFVGSRTGRSVHAVVDADGDHRADRVYTIGAGMRMPNGVAFRDGDLYVAEVSRIRRFDEIERRLDAPPDPVTVYEDLPRDSHHGWKYIAFGPDGRLYVPVGAPCNVCDEAPIYAAIHAVDLATGERRTVAHGVRNTVGFDWHPTTGSLWFTDNGRDWLGDNRPPDELNVVTDPGAHYGFPYCHGAGIPDPEFGGRECDRFTPPAIELGPHVAALGVEFYEAEHFPHPYRGQLFVAEHGSWNRSVPIGYRVSLVRIEGNRAVSYETFADGWLQGEEAWGRPVDLLELPDGSLLLSDDRAGAIYRITYEGTTAEDGAP